MWFHLVGEQNLNAVEIRMAYHTKSLSFSYSQVQFTVRAKNVPALTNLIKLIFVL